MAVLVAWNALHYCHSIDLDWLIDPLWLHFAKEFLWWSGASTELHFVRNFLELPSLDCLVHDWLAIHW